MSKYEISVWTASSRYSQAAALILVETALSGAYFGEGGLILDGSLRFKIA